MQSRESPESAYSAYHQYSTSADCRTNFASTGGNLKCNKDTSKRRRSHSKSSNNLPHSSDQDPYYKRKFNSGYESESDDDDKCNKTPPSAGKSNKVNAKSPRRTSPKNHYNSTQHNDKAGGKFKSRNGSSESLGMNSKDGKNAHLNDDTTHRKPYPFTIPRTNYSTTLNLTTQTGSIEEGQKLFGILIKPIQVSTFMASFWERKPMRINRNCQDYFKDLLSTEIIDKMLRENHVEFTKNIDITSYKDGVRETLNPIGRAMPPRIWHHYSEGCSIRLLNPQTFLPAIHSLNATLQEYFQCMTGANVYLTPPNSQGFAPHYDDIEAFVLQIEGKKHWRIYEPRSRSETLPRVSSKNFEQSELGPICMEVTLDAGDVLYLPRGFVHQANTVEDCHSLHITLSVYQKQTYGDLLEILIPMALKEAINENIILRRGLPVNIWQCMGIVNSDDYYPERDAIINQIKACFEIVSRHVKADYNLDNAVDQMAAKFQHDALPPKLTPDEERRSVYCTKAIITDDGEIDFPLIEMNTKIRLIRGNVLRMVRQGDEIRVYYSSENSKEYHGFEENFLEIDPSDAPAVEVLIKAYPKFITPDELQLEDNDKNLTVAQDLWERGILMTDEPLV